MCRRGSRSPAPQAAPPARAGWAHDRGAAGHSRDRGAVRDLRRGVPGDRHRAWRRPAAAGIPRPAHPGRLPGRRAAPGRSGPARGNAIHGLTRWAAWQVSSRSASAVTLSCLLAGRPGYPFCLSMSVRYRIGADGLDVTTTARNAGTRPAPYGTGQHPYLAAGATTVDDCELTVPAARWLPADERGIPSAPPRDVGGTPYDFRQPRQIGGTVLDHALTGLAAGGDGRVRVVLRCPGAAGAAGHAVTLWAGQGYRWLQVYTGDTLAPDRQRRGRAVEPMPCPPNAFRRCTPGASDSPGASVTHQWGISARPA